MEELAGTVIPDIWSAAASKSNAICPDNSVANTSPGDALAHTVAGRFEHHATAILASAHTGRDGNVGNC